MSSNTYVGLGLRWIIRRWSNNWSQAIDTNKFGVQQEANRTQGSSCKHLAYAASCCSFNLELVSFADSIVTKELHVIAL